MSTQEGVVTYKDGEYYISLDLLCSVFNIKYSFNSQENKIEIFTGNHPDSELENCIRTIHTNKEASKLSISGEYAIPENEEFSFQWGLYNSGQAINKQVGTKGVDINVLPAWTVTMGNPSTIIGVLDTGIEIENKSIQRKHL